MLPSMLCSGGTAWWPGDHAAFKSIYNALMLRWKSLDIQRDDTPKPTSGMCRYFPFIVEVFKFLQYSFFSLFLELVEFPSTQL